MQELAAWYHSRPGDVLAARYLTRNSAGISAVILTGAPGVGKTAFAEALSEAHGGAVVAYQAHHWTSEDDLFVKIDPARVAGIAGGVPGVGLADAYRDGALLRAVRASQVGFTVLLLDEWDKSPERADALLLGFLQDGRVQGPFGEEWEADSKNLAVVVTSNDARPLSEPLLRRAWRYAMPFLPENVERDIIRKATGASVGVARLIASLLVCIRKAGVTSPSLQEGMELARMLNLCSDIGAIELAMRGWLIKDAADEAAVVAQWGSMAKVAATLRGESKR